MDDCVAYFFLYHSTSFNKKFKKVAVLVLPQYNDIRLGFVVRLCNFVDKKLQLMLVTNMKAIRDCPVTAC